MTIAVDRCKATAEVISGGPEVLESLAPEWERLCDDGTWNQDPFCRPEWSIAYLRAYEVKKEVVAATARVDGRLRAVLPLIREHDYLWGIPVRMLRQAISDEMPRFDLALTADRTEAGVAVQKLWRILRDDPNWDIVELAPVPKTASLWQLLTAAERDGALTGFQRSFRTPIVSLSGLPCGGEEPWLANTSQRFRHELRRKIRRLQEKGCLRFERIDRATPDALGRFYELERSTWKAEIGRAVLSNSRRLRFHDEIAREAQRSGYLTVFFLTLNDRLVAASTCIEYRGKLFGSRCAFDPAFSLYSPGHILINWILRDCAARGVSELDFMGESQDWKLCWTSQRVEHGYCYIFRRGLFGHALHALKFRAVPLGRKLLHRPLRDW